MVNQPTTDICGMINWTRVIKFGEKINIDIIGWNFNPWK